ncbi:hypothetical protein [Natronorubrum tibetense]|uniref:Uncharacterized protein n=1 Tax=Natronorubrum tibetense GA33 TaxID=1114856 RepID=L9VKQ6_9EURY|nr:hypothetical protein [Natronorubrum tibetense]ELY37651.1 hypothetical protein C496_19115 [Natronorubrum tibetense GA33]
MSDTTDTKNGSNDRIKQLRDAQKVVKRLEDTVDEDKQMTQRIRSNLHQAGLKIRSNEFEKHMENAMGAAAGLAIEKERDAIAEEATLVFEK